MIMLIFVLLASAFFGIRKFFGSSTDETGRVKVGHWFTACRQQGTDKRKGETVN